ncbi:hypothetical protein PGB90_000867 [Kerria lacca]
MDVTLCLLYLKYPNYSAPIQITNEEESSWIAAYTPIGAILGALPAGMIADTFGRKLTLIVFTVPWTRTWILTTLVPSVTFLYIARFISGVIVGMFYAVLSMYVAEIAEVSIRGTLGTLFQVFLTMEILFDLRFRDCPFISYLMQQYFSLLVITEENCELQMLQQLSGVNGVIFFAEKIFNDAGSTNSAICTLIVGIVQTIATIVSSVLVDRAGRRILLLISSTGMAISLIGLGYYFWLKSHGNAGDLGWLPLISLVAFIIVFSLGLGPIPWMMSNEVMGPEIKSFGCSATVAMNWICVSLVTFYFQPLQDVLGAATTFWIFSAICVAGVIFVLLVLPETKGKSIQEIQNELAGIKNINNVNGKV